MVQNLTDAQCNYSQTNDLPTTSKIKCDKKGNGVNGDENQRSASTDSNGFPVKAIISLVNIETYKLINMI